MSNLHDETVVQAYHDMATHNSTAGTGGLDASIQFELDRDEVSETSIWIRDCINEQSYRTLVMAFSIPWE